MWKNVENNDEIILYLKEKFWKDVNQWISKEIKNIWIKWFTNVNKILWWNFFNSCFHSDEFWIWSYRVSSLINQSEIWNWIWIKWDALSVDYLDTITTWWIKWFPNIKLSSKSWWLNLFSEIYKKWNKILNLSAKEKIKFWNNIFDDFINISAFEKNIFNQKVLEFFKNILKELWIYEKISEEIKFFKDDEKNLENKIISFLFREKILENSLKIKKDFSRNLMQKKYLNWFFESEMYWEFQNVILWNFISENFWDKKEILEENWILNWWKINFENSYNNEETVEKFSKSIKEILSDTDLWEDFFNTFFENLLKKSWWRPVKIMNFVEWNLKKDLFVYKENWEIVFYKWKMKNPEKIENKDWFDILSWKWVKNYNLSWNLTILLMWIWWWFHIWSERWYRELAWESILKFFKKKWWNVEWISNYVNNIVLWLWVFDTFDEWWDNSWKNLAWSVWSLPWDMYKMWIIWWDFAKWQVKNFIEDNLKIPEFNEVDFINSFENILNKTDEKIWKLSDIKISDWLIEKYMDKRNELEKNKNLKNFLDLIYLSYKINKIVK